MLSLTSASRYHPRLDVHPWSDSTEFRGIGRDSSDCIRAMMAQVSQIKTKIIRSVALLDMPAWVFYKGQMRIILLCNDY